ncbi:tetratricopeptide repeat protein [Hamadaea tsunoensis]|uniref:tetratricopeptide repeat protein n=1 Tax=Hamadaea tsunoensis TaxID=53368 RepID=UPI00068768C5|nr:tetratricopeptide repeat protein [Hamadaea tsunoensis]
MALRTPIIVVALAAGLTVTAGIALRHHGDRPATTAAAVVDPAADLERFAERTRRHLDDAPRDWTGWAALGMAYVQLGRITGDPAHYTQAAAALDRSLEVEPAGNAAALTGQAALSAAQHRFGDAVTHARAAVAADAYSADAYGILADGLIETGHYDEAFADVQKMVDLRPDTTSFARASYTFELRGQIDRAAGLMRQALQVAENPADEAFAYTHLAELAFNRGDPAAARTEADAGLSRAPSNAGLLAVRGRIRAAQGDLSGAAADLRAAIALQPLPAYAVQLGDALTAAGDQSAADQAYALVEAAHRLAVAQHQPSDIDFVLYYADRGTDVTTEARALYAGRSSNQVADAYAWALHAAGRDREALPLADRALSLGTTDALAHFHRGEIRLALGDRSGARADLAAALRTNPHFSPRYAAAAQSTLRSLGGAA